GVVVAGATLPVGEAQVAALASRRGAPVSVGIRPEQFELGASGIPARVELVEPLGSETLVHWTSDVGRLVSRVTAGPVPAPGESGLLGAKPDRILLFDAKS